MPFTEIGHLLASLEHPVLSQVDRASVARFISARNAYELRIKNLNELFGNSSNLTPASYLISIEPDLLQQLDYLGQLESVAPGITFRDLTSEQLKTFIHSITANRNNNIDEILALRATDDIRVPMDILDPKGTIIAYFVEFQKRLRDIGYGDYR